MKDLDAARFGHGGVRASDGIGEFKDSKRPPPLAPPHRAPRGGRGT
jgi:hypothetical protein